MSTSGNQAPGGANVDPANVHPAGNAPPAVPANVAPAGNAPPAVPAVPAVAARAAAAPAAGRDNPQPQFFLNPASAMVGILDFTDVESRKYYHKATKKLDSEELFDCSPENMHHFLKLLDYRAKEHGWDNYVSGILWVPEDVNDPNSDLRYLPDEYG